MGSNPITSTKAQVRGLRWDPQEDQILRRVFTCLYLVHVTSESGTCEAGQISSEMPGLVWWSDSELDSEHGLEGRRRWTDAGDAVDSVAPKLSMVVYDKEDQVAILGVAQ